MCVVTARVVCVLQWSESGQCKGEGGGGSGGGDVFVY